MYSHTVDFLQFSARLTDTERQALSGLRSWLSERVQPLVNEYWEKAEFPKQILPEFHAQPIFGMQWEETKSFANSAIYRGWVALELARIDASIATYVGVQNGLVMGAIGIAGSSEQRLEWLGRLASGKIIGAFALTEPNSGSDISLGLSTTAERDGDSWVISGEKRWIGNATFSDIVVVWARDVADSQIKGFIVPSDTPGYTATKIDRKQALRMVQNADIRLDRVRVPESLRLAGASSFRDTAQVLQLTRVEVAWAAAGVALGAYQAAAEYAKSRVQFGKPLAAHQLIQRHLAEMMGDITAAIALCTRVSEMLDENTLGDEHASLAKAFTTARMRDVVARAREILGGNGVVLDYDVARFMADAEALYSYEGTREVNTLIVGRALTGLSAFV